MEEESLLLKDVLSCDIQLSEFITVLDAYRAREQEPRKETLERGIQTASLPVTRTSASQTSQYVNPVVEKTVLRKSRNASVGGNEPIPVLIDRVTQCRPWDEIVREYENSIGELQERVKAVGIAWEERVARVTKAHDTVVSRLDDNISELKSENVSLRATNMEGNLRERKLQTEVFQRSEECQQLQTRIEELRREIERGNHRCYDLEVQIKRLEDEGAQCRHALGTEKAQSSFFQTKLRDTENTVEILQARIAETDRLLSMTKANQESLEHSVTEKNHELKSIRSQMEETQTEMVQTQTENEKLVESSMELERMVQNLVAKNRELMSMIEILQWEEGDNMGLGLNDVPFTRDTDHILHQMIARNNVRISLLEEKNRELRHKRSELGTNESYCRMTKT
ncbi:hypothetical protein BC832DRAFT_360888 [Gaertneriomyces semiglobifer]|nr:hypothetical protein BC832DRAFT_360888 [Gaertneriomyces semiglobifer]